MRSRTGASTEMLTDGESLGTGTLPSPAARPVHQEIDMNPIRNLAGVMTLATALALPGMARAEAPAAPAEPAASMPGETPAAMPPGMGMRHEMGMGPGMGMGMGPMAGGDRCAQRKPAMMKMRQSCRMAGDAQADKRIEMLEKRLDAMQLTLELLVRQQAETDGR